MKKYILLAVFALVALASAQAQTKYAIVETRTIESDQKLNFIIQRMVSNERSVLPQLEALYAQEKQQTDTVLYAKEAQTFYQKTRAALEEYINSMSYNDSTWYYEYPSDYTMQGSGGLNGKTFGFDFYLNNDTTQLGVIEKYDYYQLQIDGINNGTVLDISENSTALIKGYQTMMAEQVQLYQALIKQRE